MGVITFKAQGVSNVFRDRQRLRRWLTGIARDHGHRINELSFVLMSDDDLLLYNTRYLGHDNYTDVITFDLQTGTGLSGDVLISLDRVRDNAAEYGASVQHELRRVMVHGLLHLLGHRDKNKRQREAMRVLEDAALERFR